MAGLILGIIVVLLLIILCKLIVYIKELDHTGIIVSFYLTKSIRKYLFKR